MPSFFVILIKMNLILAFFVMAYFLVLRRLTFYSLNRIFLVSGILFSSLYPFIDLTDFFYHQQIAAFVPAINERVTELAPSAFILAYGRYIRLLFYVGAAVMAVRLALQFITLYKLHKNSSRDVVNHVPVRILKELVSPFSFWQTIYINPSLHNEKDLKAILAHEHIHIRQWHTLDIILAELSVVFYWFNPGVWMMKKAIKENLEFITDEKVLRLGIDKKAYQYSLLDVGNLVASNKLANSFNISDLRKRINMMNARRSSRLNLGRYVLVVPVLVVIALLSTVTKREIKEYFASVEPPVVQTDNSNTSKAEVITGTKKKANKAIKFRAAQANTRPDPKETVDQPDKASTSNRMQTSVPVRVVPLGEVKGIAGDVRYSSIGSPSGISQPITNGNKDKDDEIVVVGYASPTRRVQGLPVNTGSNGSAAVWPTLPQTRYNSTKPVLSVQGQPPKTVQGFPIQPTPGVNKN